MHVLRIRIRSQQGSRVLRSGPPLGCARWYRSGSRGRPAGFRPTDPYVRRFWVAAIGSAAVAELLRLVRAAEKGEGVRLPRYLPSLIRTGLVKAESSGLVVMDHIPEVPKNLRWRFPPSLAADHNRWLGLSPHREPGHEESRRPPHRWRKPSPLEHRAHRRGAIGSPPRPGGRRTRRRSVVRCAPRRPGPDRQSERRRRPSPRLR